MLGCLALRTQVKRDQTSVDDVQRVAEGAVELGSRHEVEMSDGNLVEVSLSNSDHIVAVDGSVLAETMFRANFYF